MTLKRSMAVVLLLAVGLLVYQISVLSAQDSTPEATETGITTCNVPFEATVRQGPSSGTTLNGQLDVTIDASGVIEGNVILPDNSEIPVMGQVDGRAINMALDLSTAEQPGVYVFGVGTAIDPIQSDTCGTALGGPFVGPAKGDSGDWLAGSPVAEATPEATPAA